MAYLNENYLKLQAGYLFPEVARRVREFCEANPEAAKRLIRCGIGDVTEPLPRSAMVRNRATNFSDQPSRRAIIATAISRLPRTKFLSLTDQNAIAVTSSIFSATKTKWRFPIRFIRCMSIQT